MDTNLRVLFFFINTLLTLQRGESWEDSVRKHNLGTRASK